MARPRSERLRPVARVAESREEVAAQRFGQSQQQLAQQRNQLEQLRQYRIEYQHRVIETGKAGIAAGQLMQLQRFLGQVDLAIKQQEQAVVMAERECHQHRQVWLDAKGHTQAIDKVIERYRHVEIQAADRQEQKNLDEAALRRLRPQEE